MQQKKGRTAGVMSLRRQERTGSSAQVEGLALSKIKSLTGEKIKHENRATGRWVEVVVKFSSICFYLPVKSEAESSADENRRGDVRV